MKVMDINEAYEYRYTVDLLCWYYGLRVSEIKTMEWTEEEIKKAEDYAKKNGIDVFGYAERYGML